MDAKTVIILILICVAIGALVVRARRKIAHRPPSYSPRRGGRPTGGGRGNTEER